jgi:hypothetical protein
MAALGDSSKRGMWRSTDVARRLPSPPVRSSAAIFSTLLVLSLAELWTELTYDEAVYLLLARTIAETGLPLRRAYEDFTEFRLFANSPPLVMYVASVSQWLFPGQDIPTRIIHLSVFVFPTYTLLWWAAHRRFGGWAAVASLLALLTSIGYLRGTSHVSLNIPLGLLALAGLLTFHDASSEANARRRSLSTIAGLSMALSIWTKYQAVCLAVAMVAYLVYTVVSSGYAGLRPALLPLSFVFVSGAAALGALLAYFGVFGGVDTLTGTLTWNVGRATAGSMSMPAVARSLVNTARECQTHLGAVALLLGVLALYTERRQRGLVVLLASYVAATIGFNLILFRLPGAGSVYLDSAVPALALLAGPAAVRVIALAATTAGRAALALAMIVLQLAGSPAYAYQQPRPKASRVAAAYIAAHGQARSGVLAETVAIEFYSRHPVRAASFTYPRELVLRSLEGTSGDDISFVVVRRGVTPANLDSIRPQWDTLLSRHFELVSADAAGLDVYRRKSE